MYRDNKIDPHRQSEFQKMKQDLASLKNEFVKFKKDYEDTIWNLDIENCSLELIAELIKQVKHAISFTNSSGDQIFFEIKKDENGQVSIYLNGRKLGHENNGVFNATGTWDFSGAHKIE